MSSDDTMDGIHGSLRPGLNLCETRSQPALPYRVYLPRQPGRQRRVLVAVHGISRNAGEQIELLRPWAERYGIAVIAPVFSKRLFRDYQRLGRMGRGPRADLALIRLLNEFSGETGLDTSDIDLFGFSGGAQFAHRFAMSYPQRLNRLVLGAAGWYTMPDEDLSYPYGTADPQGLGPLQPNLLAASKVRTLVVVGENDDRIDEELNQSTQVRETQGIHRLERGRRWVRSMNEYARVRGQRSDVSFCMMPGVGHSFSEAVMRGGLMSVLFDFLYPSGDDDVMLPRSVQSEIILPGAETMDTPA